MVSDLPELFLDDDLLIVQLLDVDENVLADRDAQLLHLLLHRALGILVVLALDDFLVNVPGPVDGDFVVEHVILSRDVPS